MVAADAPLIQLRGVTKTYQAMIDEEVERAEAQLMAQREIERREMEAAAEGQARDETGQGDEDMEGMQRDLDYDVPAAEDPRNKKRYSCASPMLT